jgi:hypothetical protein
MATFVTKYHDLHPAYWDGVQMLFFGYLYKQTKP